MVQELPGYVLRQDVHGVVDLHGERIQNVLELSLFRRYDPAVLIL